MQASRRTFFTIAAGMLLAGPVGRGQSHKPAEPDRLLQRRIPATGEAVPAVGLGTWQSFMPDQRDEASLARLQQVLEVFHAGGGRVVDTSPMYAPAEELVGQLSTRAGLNGSLFLATKVWTNGVEAGRGQFDNSLRLLQRQQIELMQVHNLRDAQTMLPLLRRGKEEGRFKYIGVTHYVPAAFDALARVIADGSLDFVQLPFNIEMPDAQERLLPLAAETGTAVIVNVPFGGGGLFGKVRGRPLPEAVGGWADSWAQAFLKWILARPEVTVVIPGTGNPRHAADNVQAMTGRLPTRAERDALAAAIRDA